MTTENVTINLEFVGEVSDSQREMLEKLFAGTEVQNEQCCGEPEDCVSDKPEGAGVWFTPEPETCSVNGCDEPGVWWTPPVNEVPESYVSNTLLKLRAIVNELAEQHHLDQYAVQFLLEADAALEDAQIHIADQAEKAKLQAEEDEIVAEWRIAILQASPVTASNIADWDMMAEDTKRMWRERFYGNMEWLENFAKGDK